MVIIFIYYYSIMKNAEIPLFFLVVLLLLVTSIKSVYDVMNKQPIIIHQRAMYPQTFYDQHRRSPEYRPPPYKTYKPSDFQQMGILTGNDGQILPLYGKPSDAYRTRWNYYTTTPGNQIYPLPIQHKERDCTEDIGCDEFYGREEVSVTGMGEGYTAQIYNNKIM